MLEDSKITCWKIDYSLSDNRNRSLTIINNTINDFLKANHFVILEEESKIETRYTIKYNATIKTNRLHCKCKLKPLINKLFEEHGFFVVQSQMEYVESKVNDTPDR